MSTVIKLKRSETASTPPATGDLQTGEVAINSADKKMFVKDSGGNVVQLANSLELFEDLVDVDTSTSTSTLEQMMISDGDGTYSFQDNTIANHKDVDMSGTPSSGNILAWNPNALLGAGAWAVAANPAELISTTVTAPGTPNLTYNTSTKRITYTPPNLAGVGDVNITSPADGQILVYNNGSSEWQNVNGSFLEDITVTTNAAGTPALTYDGTSAFSYTPPNFAGLDDTNFVSLANGDHLQWDGTDWVNVDNPVAGLSVTTAAAGTPSLSVDTAGTFTYTPPNFQGLGDVDTGTSATTANMRMISDGDGTYSFVNDTIDTLSDTNFSSLSFGNFMTYDGSAWRNVMISQLSDLTVTTNAPGSPALSFLGTTLTYTPPNFEGLSDVDVSTATSTANMKLRSDGDGTYSFVADTLGSLNDVTFGGPLQVMDVILWSGSNWVRSQIKQLNELTITTAAAGNPSLVFDGTDTLTYTPPNLNGISDVTITAPAAGDALVYDGSGWVNESGNGAPTTTNDVTIGEVQKYDTGTETWTVEDMYGASSQRIKREVVGSDIVYTFA